MDDDLVAQFTAITSADPERAAQYLRVTDNNLEQAIQLFFESDGIDMGSSAPAAAQQPAADPQQTSGRTATDPVTIDSDDEDQQTPAAPTAESDEAMARRLQEEMYGAPGDASVQGPGEQGVRAPIGRTTETLLGPTADWTNDRDEMQAAIAEQMLARQNRRAAGRPGIFNQAAPSSASIWDDNNPEARRQELSRATAGASDASSKTSMLAEMYRPPYELISPLRSWEGVRAEGKEQEKWILINVQDQNIFDCQVLNRDIWKNPSIQDTVREHFIFKQYTKDDPQAQQYTRFYFHAIESQDAYPHIAIVDPRTGEQVKVWSGAPVPKAPDFLMQLHEFLDRYSLKANTKNPVAMRKPEKRPQMDVEKLSEEEQLRIAMANSLESRPGPREEDPDGLTRDSGLDEGKGKEKLSDQGSNGTDHNGAEASPFAQISSTTPHEEPEATTPNTTRIQFRHSDGRVIRRFGLADPVRRIYEWLKASPLEGKEGVPFDLISMGKNLMDVVDQTIEEAKLKNGTVMIQFNED